MITLRTLREGSFKKKLPYLALRANRGGGEVCQNTNLLNRFFCDIIELYELQNKVSIQNMLCFLYELTVTAIVGADLFNFGLTVYSTNT